MRRLSILGSTGSIGKQTLEVARKAPSDFTVEALLIRFMTRSKNSDLRYAPL